MMLPMPPDTGQKLTIKLLVGLTAISVFVSCMFLNVVAPQLGEGLRNLQPRAESAATILPESTAASFATLSPSMTPAPTSLPALFSTFTPAPPATPLPSATATAIAVIPTGAPPTILPSPAAPTPLPQSPVPVTAPPMSDDTLLIVGLVALILILGTLAGVSIRPRHAVAKQSKRVVTQTYAQSTKVVPSGRDNAALANAARTQQANRNAQMLAEVARVRREQDLMALELEATQQALQKSGGNSPSKPKGKTTRQGKRTNVAATAADPAVDRVGKGTVHKSKPRLRSAKSIYTKINSTKISSAKNGKHPD